MKIIVLVLVIGVSYVHLEESLLCSEEFCANVTAKEKCRDVSELCKIQNKTHSGVFLPSPTPCNCCDYCLENLGEDDVCTFGDPISSAPANKCGYGLACKKSEKINPKCQTIETKCTTAQKEYDDNRASGKLGHLVVRPECDAHGLYKPYVCVPGEICYCVAEDGTRIFGEIPANNLSDTGMNCTCSRSFHQASNLISPNLYITEHFRCQSNGDFDTIQCLNSECFCVDPSDGHPFNSTKDTVNIRELWSKTIWCFNNETHEEFTSFYRECESTYSHHLEVLKKNTDNGIEVLEFSFPNCQLDGYFAPVQQSKTAKYCVDPRGRILENFEVSISNSLSNNINCKCARARSIIADAEKPECCENGNYKSVQCRRGWCRCVDENGQQYEKEVELEHVEKLSCCKKKCT